MDQRSKCANGYLHRYEIIGAFKEGVIEQCLICKDKKYFRENIPNYLYLFYHQRSALPKEHNFFNNEYNKKW